MPAIRSEKLSAIISEFHGVALPVLVELFGHSTQRQTLDYLCVQDEEILEVYMNEI